MSRTVGGSDDGTGGEQDRAGGGSPATGEMASDVPGNVANQAGEAQCIFTRLDHVCVNTDAGAAVTTSG